MWVLVFQSHPHELEVLQTGTARAGYLRIDNTNNSDYAFFAETNSSMNGSAIGGYNSFSGSTAQIAGYYGIYGYSSNGNGVYGYSSNTYGVNGYSASDYGIYPNSNTFGVYGGSHQQDLLEFMVSKPTARTMVI